MLTRSQARSLERDGFMIIDHFKVEQDIHREPNLLNGYVPQVKPLLLAGLGSSGSSSSSSYYTANTSFSTSSSSYYTANTSFSTSSSSSLYFTPNASFEEEKPGEYLLKDGVTRHILSVETLDNIARKQQTKLEQIADRELEALLKERDLAYDPEERGFDMDVGSDPEYSSDDDSAEVTSQDSASVTDACRDTDSVEAADTVAPLASPSKKPRSLGRTDTEVINPSNAFRTASTPMDIGNWRCLRPLRGHHMERWNI
ncbi:hypothetical protein C0995_005950 [Termitomyces sp. Mi166|nr:hypothetical protein C0995_005950 [Termitomyces sp. Mi166\